MAKKELEIISQKNILIERCKDYIVDQKHEGWVETAKDLDEMTLTETAKIMEMLSSGISSKAANKELNKIKDQSVKSNILKLVTNFSKNGPEFALDRVKQSNGGKIDRTNEYVQGLFYKMDENASMREMEK